MSRCSFEEIQKEDELLLSPEQAMQEIVDGTRRKSILGDWIPVSIQEMTQNSAITEEGCRYTWSNNQGGKGRVMSKIDRSLINAEWIDIIICLTRKLTISLQTAQTTALDRLRKIGLDVPSECPLCGKLPETAEHIFLHCEYSQRCRQMLEQKLQVRAQGSDLSQFSNWLHKPVAGSVRSQVVQCVFLSFLYHVWWQRNQAIWQGCIARHKRVVEQIITEAYWRIISVLPKKTSNRDRIWIRDILS
ncbi:hypothetical protein SOVF_204870 [Spinacia oleracea]|nr:hypothetical protein SOVF_204870 [Spinacia oleracea]